MTGDIFLCDINICKFIESALKFNKSTLKRLMNLPLNSISLPLTNLVKLYKSALKFNQSAPKFNKSSPKFNISGSKSGFVKFKSRLVKYLGEDLLDLRADSLINLNISPSPISTSDSRVRSVCSVGQLASHPAHPAWVFSVYRQ